MAKKENKLDVFSSKNISNEISSPEGVNRITRKRLQMFKRKREIGKSTFRKDEKNNESIAECRLCKKKFLNKGMYTFHLKMKHSIIAKPLNLTDCKRHELTNLLPDKCRTYPCLQCNKKFFTAGDLRVHVKVVHLREKSFICEECGKGYVTAAALNSHKIVHSEDKPFKCLKCYKTFKRLPTLKLHMESHENRKCICFICGKQINSLALLRRHMVFHSDEKKYKCNFCKKEFRRPDAFKNHLILHTSLKPYQCLFCELTFADGSNCRKHQKSNHPMELAAAEADGIKRVYKNVPKIQQLRDVNNGVSQEGNLKIVHVKERPFVCEICDKRTTSKRSLEVHKLVHVKATHNCKVCSKLFKNEERLNVHKKTHENIDVSCPVCNLKLKNNKALSEHMSKHTVLKNLKCPLCEYASKCRRNLRAHMLAHTGLKPYHCSFCEISYANRSNCTKHEKRAHPVEFNKRENDSIKTRNKNVSKFKINELKQMLLQMKQKMCVINVDNISVKEIEVINTRLNETKVFSEVLDETSLTQEDSNIVSYISKGTDVESCEVIENCIIDNEDVNEKNVNSKKLVAECKICNKTFLSKGGYAFHLKAKHSVINEPIPCKFCGKLFKATSAHQKHEAIHLPPEKRKTFPCLKCDKKFFWEGGLNAHVKIVHVNEKSFICEECGKGFITIATLNSHKVIHTEEKPFNCQKCPKSFKRLPALKEHMLNAHTVTKNFKCPICEYASRCRRNLRTHMLTHTGLKPYQCSFCEISYTDRSNCKKHEKYVHPMEFAEMQEKSFKFYNKNIPKFKTNELKEILEKIKKKTS